MNIPVLPDIPIPLSHHVVDPLRPVLWRLSFENGYTISSEHSTWNEIAQTQALDTLSLPFTWGNVEALDILSHDQPVITLRAPSPLPFFGLTRLAQGIVEASPTWVGSLFGYALDSHIVCLTIHPGSMQIQTHPRPLTSFTLL